MDRLTIQQALQEGYTLTVLRTDSASLAPLVQRAFSSVAALEAELEHLCAAANGRCPNVVHWRLQTCNRRLEFDARFVVDGPIDLCRGVQEYTRIILSQPRGFTIATVARAKVMEFAAQVLAEQRRRQLARVNCANALFSLSMALLQTSLDRSPRLGAFRTQTGNG